MSQTETEGEWRVVDDRLFECPNGCGLLAVEGEASVHCPDCGYVRTVFEYVKDGEQTYEISQSQIERLRDNLARLRETGPGRDYDLVWASNNILAEIERGE